MLTIYFSGTGNTKYIAERFSEKMNARCLSIEADVSFPEIIASNDIIALCYPIYGSRAPLIMREFVAAHMAALKGKKLVIFVTQVAFSGDGARALTDLFPKGHADVIYAEHFLMPNNVCNFALVPRTGEKTTRKKLDAAGKKLERIRRDIAQGVVKRRGFSMASRLLGLAQGIPWQGDSKNAFAEKGSMEYRAKHGVRIDGDCTACGLCVKACPMKNLERCEGKVAHKNNCTMCYRCVNLCPQRAITVYFHKKPKWQYEGIELLGQ